MGDNFKKRIKIGGITRIIHIVISLILSLIIFLDSRLTNNLLWDIFILNAPVLFDFLHDYYCAPQEKIGLAFKSISLLMLFILSLSFILSVVYVGIDYGIENKVDSVKSLAKTILEFEHFSIICNPFGVFLGYICTILKEEHRIEKGEHNN